jgi:hypothetical protein
MTISYRNTQTNAPFRKTVRIIQVNPIALSATGIVPSEGVQYSIDLSKYMGSWAHYPSIGDEWIISQILGFWTLERRTSSQNTANAAIKTGNPGDTVLSGPVNLKLVSTPLQLVDSPLTSNSDISGNHFYANGDVVYTPIGSGGSAYGPNITSYTTNPAYGKPIFFKRNGMVYVRGLFLTTSTLANDGIIFQVSASCFPFLSSGETRAYLDTISIGGITGGNTGIARLYVDSVGNCRVSIPGTVAPPGYNPIPTGANFSINTFWPSTTF